MVLLWSSNQSKRSIRGSLELLPQVVVHGVGKPLEEDEEEALSAVASKPASRSASRKGTAFSSSRGALAPAVQD